MEYIRIAKLADLAGVRVKSFRILGKYIGIVREPGGALYATEIMCKHNNADLSTGCFRGDIVTCARHGWQYNIRTGECLTNNSTPLRRHALRLEGDDLYVSLHPIAAQAPEEEEFPEIEFRKRDG